MCVTVCVLVCLYIHVCECVGECIFESGEYESFVFVCERECGVLSVCYFVSVLAYLYEHV